MPYDRFMIAPINSGLQTDQKPFMIMDDSFAQLDNAYCFRGRVRKRFGSLPMDTSDLPVNWQQHTRLRVAIPGGVGIGITTSAPVAHAGTAAGTIPNNGVAGNKGHLGQMFSIGNEYYTVIDGTVGVHNMNHTGVGTGTFDIQTGNYAFQDAPQNTQIYFYPSYPVMGFATYEIGQINNNPTIAFDEQFAYQFAAGAWNRIGLKTWTGDDSYFFWCCNWRDLDSAANRLFVTNFNPADGIWYWDGTAALWTDLNAQLDSLHATTIMTSCRVLVLFKDRLVALNTWESIDNGVHNINYRNRARWSGNGSPINPAWNDNLRGVGYGSFDDCPSKDTITSAQILKDRLIVYFAASTWELVYTGNEIQPFRWQQINIELGAESTFSQIPFDRAILGVGNVGIMSCNGAQVQRIDEKIPDSVFQIHSGGDGPQRVAGVRDYFTELAYWAFPSNTGYIADDQPHYPNRVLVYNYRDASWAFNDDAITAFGYYYQQNAQTWASMGRTWESVEETWDSGQLAAQPRQIIAGNQEGFTFIINTNQSRNSMGLSITNINRVNGVLTVINHNLASGSFILIENCIGTAINVIDNLIFKVVVIDINTFTLRGYDVITNTLIDVVYPANFVYQGGGTIARVSVINIWTKQYNLYLDKGRNAYIAKVDFQVDNDDGDTTVNCFSTYNINTNLVAAGAASGALLGTSELALHPYFDALGHPVFPAEVDQASFWHPVYFQAEGESVQFQITLTDNQVSFPIDAFSDFQLNAFTIYAMPTTSRLQ